jgi:hypothetical protein
MIYLSECFNRLPVDTITPYQEITNKIIQAIYTFENYNRIKPNFLLISENIFHKLDYFNTRTLKFTNIDIHIDITTKDKLYLGYMEEA